MSRAKLCDGCRKPSAPAIELCAFCAVCGWAGHNRCLPADHASGWCPQTPPKDRVNALTGEYEG